ncbi:MAG: hypothetical protein ND807_17120 [Vicinamibacterales bacterium]|nr:hypothetical protein [Vicinamibacterales bacterium]
MAGSPELSPRGAVIAGLFCIALGVFPILGALGVIDLRMTPGTPVWVGVAAGVVFVLGGLVIVNSYAIGPKAISDADGLSAAGPYRAFAQILLTTMICVTLAAIAGWVAFGPGEREFSTGGSLPFYSSRGKSSGWGGRAVFGAGAIFAAVMAVAVAVAGFRRAKR